MNTTAIALSVVFLATDASAISRYDVDTMTCDRVHAIVQSEGAAILRYRSSQNGITLYDRYVSDRTYCRRTQEIDQVGLPTSDRASCPVYKCAQSYRGSR